MSLHRSMRERLAGVVCSRCQERRWPFKAWAEPYTCQRCRSAEAGKPNVIDPLGSEAQRAARMANLGHFFGASRGVSGAQPTAQVGTGGPTAQKRQKAARTGATA